MQKHWKVIDGRHRLRACEELGIEPRFEHVEWDERRIYDFVLSDMVRLKRITASQRAVWEAINEPREHGGDRKSAAQKSSLQNVNLISVDVIGPVGKDDRAAAAWLVKNDRDAALALVGIK